MNNRSALVFVIPSIIVGSVLVLTPACKSDSSSDPPPVVFGTTGVVVGAADTHCGAKVVTVDPAQCTNPKSDDTTPDAGSTGGATDGGDAGPAADAGAPADDMTSDFGPTNYGFEADDDDCKYHVKWAMTGNAENTNVNFTVVVSAKVDGSAERAVPISAEVFLNDTHPAPNSGQQSGETSTPGTYKVGPIKFDAPGQWTVRFHLHEECDDSDESPHGHAAFFVQIP